MLDDQQPLRLPRANSQQLRFIHQTCERFEKSWRSGQTLTIEQLLSESTIELRPYLLEALVRSEVELIESSGRSIEPREYLSRFAGDRGIIARAFMSPDKLETLDSGDELESVVGEDGPAVSGSKPHKLGHFEIRDEIARGGMGVVYRGWHDELKREVAVKCIRSGEFANESEIQRFRREAQTVASLKHDGIVPIYEVGNEQGLYYFVMPLIEGDSLGTRLTRGPIDHRELARIARDSAVATQFAHDHGVIHRDLKPSNILVDQQGKVWVADFGLSTSVQAGEAKEASIRAGSDLSVTGQIIGTPTYMSPEQVQGRSNELSDVYGLGAVLYAGLTGRPPHRAATVMQTLKQVAENEPVAPRALDPQIPKDLETITLKALSKVPSLRYASAKALADDLNRYLDGRTIVAKPASAPERIWRWVMREPLVASLAMGIMAALAIGLGVSLRFYMLAIENERNATVNAQLAQDSVEEYLTQVADSPELGDKGLEVLRRQLLQSALVFYERLASQTPSSLPLQERLAEAHDRLGMIHSSVGQLDRAGDEFQKMLNVYRQLQAEHPLQIEYKRRIVDALAQRAQVFADQSKTTECGQLISEAIELCKVLVARQQNTLPDQVMLASLYALQVEHYNNSGNADDAKKRLLETAPLCETLVKSADETLSQLSGKRLGRTLDRMASQLQNAGEYDATEKLCKLGIEFCSSELMTKRNDPQIRFIEARLHKNLNLLYSRTNRLEEATTEFELCDRILAELLSEHPLVFEYLDSRATLLVNVGNTFLLKGQYEESRKLLEESIEIQKQIIARQPAVIEHWNALGIMYASLGANYRSLSRQPEAETALKLGIQANEKLRQVKPDFPGANYFGLHLKNSLAETYYAQKRYEEAVGLLRPLTGEIKSLVEKNQAIPGYQLLAAGSYRSLASTERKLNNAAAAETAADQAITFFEMLPPQVTSVGATPRALTDALYTKGICYLLKSQYAQATEAIDRGVSVLNRLLDDPKTPPTNVVLLKGPRADFHDLAGQIAAAQQEHLSALEHYHKAIADQLLIMEQMKNQPLMLESQIERHALTQIHVARSLLQLKRIPDALQACDKAIELNTSDAPEAKALRAEIEKSKTEP